MINKRMNDALICDGRWFLPVPVRLSVCLRKLPTVKPPLCCCGDTEELPLGKLESSCG